MDLYGSVWICIYPYGSYSIRFHMDLKLIWIHLDLHLHFDIHTYGFVWTHMDPNGFIRIQYAFNKLFFDFLTFPCIGRCSLDGRGYKEGASMGATNANPYGSFLIHINHMDQNGSIWILMDPFGFIWICI